MESGGEGGEEEYTECFKYLVYYSFSLESIPAETLHITKLLIL